MRKRHKKQQAKIAGSHALGYILSPDTPWAITEEALRNIVAIANRENRSPEAIAAKFGRELESTQRTTVRDGVATIPVRGPMFRYANMMTRHSGATSLQVLANDLTTAVESPEVKALLLDFDTPGGEVNGTSETAQLVFDARGRKPIVAFVSYLGASGGYWVASAADEVVASDTAVLGALGVRWVHIDDSKRMEMEGLREIEIISSQTPRKRMDPTTPEGHGQLQEMANDLAGVFLTAVARYRDVSFDTVLESYGRGGVFIGAQAVEAGLADRVSTYEAVHAELVARVQSPTSTVFSLTGGQPAPNTELAAMDKDKDKKEPDAAPETPTLTKEGIEATYPEFVTAWKGEGATAERERLAGIDALAEPGHEALIAECKADADCTPETAAFRIKQAEKAANAQRLAAMKTDEDELEKPEPLAEGATGAESGAALGKQIAAQYEQLTTRSA